MTRGKAAERMRMFDVALDELKKARETAERIGDWSTASKGMSHTVWGILCEVQVYRIQYTVYCISWYNFERHPQWGPQYDSPRQMIGHRHPWISTPTQILAQWDMVFLSLRRCINDGPTSYITRNGTKYWQKIVNFRVYPNKIITFDVKKSPDSSYNRFIRNGQKLSSVVVIFFLPTAYKTDVIRCWGAPMNLPLEGVL